MISREEALEHYRIWLEEKLATGEINLQPFVGFNLACNCKPGEPCQRGYKSGENKGYIRIRGGSEPL